MNLFLKNHMKNTIVTGIRSQYSGAINSSQNPSRNADSEISIRIDVLCFLTHSIVQ